MSNENAQAEAQTEGSKLEKRFQGLMVKLEAVVGGKKNLLPRRKVSKDVGLSIVEELFKEENEALAKEVKESLRGVLKEYLEMTRNFKQEEDKLAKHKEEKTKSFCEVVEKLFAKIDGIPEIEKLYVDALRLGAAGTSTTQV